METDLVIFILISICHFSGDTADSLEQLKWRCFRESNCMVMIDELVIESEGSMGRYFFLYLLTLEDFEKRKSKTSCYLKPLFS